VDASFDDDDEGCGSTRLVIRDHSGGVIAAAHNFVLHVIDAPMAEAYALKEGLLLAQHVGENRLIIQSDCMEMVETMKDGGRQTRRQLSMMNTLLYGAVYRKS